MITKDNINKSNAWALVPMGVFLVAYLLTSIVIKDFYKVPIIVAFLLSAIVAIAMNPKESINKKLQIFCEGAGNTNIILMILIFILAGAFGQVAKDMGAVDATVNLGLSILPSYVLIAGLFIIGCFISLSIGTSTGTIVALVPVAVGIAEKINIPLGLAIGAVISGAMFGDNLSMISDTTIAAAKTQGCEMKDKFKMNILIVLPAALITAIVFVLVNRGNNVNLDNNYVYNLLKVMPYLVVLISALLGVNVISVLTGGIVLAGTVGIATGAFDIWGMVSSINTGIAGMSELIIVVLLVGGMFEIIRYNGGIDFLMYSITSKIRSKKGAEFGIAALVGVVDICTANNTIAIVLVGPIAKDISDRFGIDPRRAASILDTFSCFFQGIIPYGAQLLIAAGLANISPLSIMKYLYYPYLMGIAAILAIILEVPKLSSMTAKS